jgi:hypothetical protein
MVYRRETYAAFLVPIPIALIGCSPDLAVAQNGLDGAISSEVSDQSAPGEAEADSPIESSTPDGASLQACEADAGSPPSSDAAACFIDLNQYDRSCSLDSDCVFTVELGCTRNQNGVRGGPMVVHGGNFCDGCICNAGLAINRNAVAQYVADVSRTPEGSGQVALPVCNCPASPPGTPMCVNGMCGLSDGILDAGFAE